jgi:ABC-type transport system substrate-binding protein
MVQRTADGDFEGALAERWELAEDAKGWTYHLRTNIRWHDGVPVTAHDIAFSIDLLQHPDVLAGMPETSYTVIDDHTIELRFSRMTDNPDSWTAYFPKHILEDLDPKGFWEWDFWNQPVGNGPYRYVHHVPKTMVEVEANPDYFSGKPKIDKVVIKFGGDPLVELLSGNVQGISWSDRDALPKLAGDGRRAFRMILEPQSNFLRKLDSAMPIMMESWIGMGSLSGSRPFSIGAEGNWSTRLF